MTPPTWQSDCGTVRLFVADVMDGLTQIPLGSVHCVVTSPPYWGLRRYLDEGHPDKHHEIGLEPTLESYIAKMVQVFREVRRVLHPSGTCWVNLGDSYSNDGKWGGSTGGKHVEALHGDTNVGRGKKTTGLKPKDLCGVPWRVAFALQADGWFLRSSMPWVKRSAMPESVTDRPASALEHVFMLTKSARYFFDMEAVRRKPLGISGGACIGKVELDGPGSRRWTKEDRAEIDGAGRNYRNADLWFESVEGPHGLTGYGDELVGLDVVATAFKDAHFATFSPNLVSPLIKAGTSEHGCCPKCGGPWRREVATGDWNPDRKRDLSHGRNVNKTTGWSPGCTCGLDPVPCLCLDPFMGSGTVALVAAKLGRHAVGIELSQAYADMAIKRIKAALAQPRLFPEPKPPPTQLRMGRSCENQETMYDWLGTCPECAKEEAAEESLFRDAK